jgi:rhamnose utilization protein RhaD (predicted bifunctional aldolase and dehydrogenase)
VEERDEESDRHTQQRRLQMLHKPHRLPVLETKNHNGMNLRLIQHKSSNQLIEIIRTHDDNQRNKGKINGTEG